MKVHLEKDVGYLACKDRQGKKEAIIVRFPIESLLDWYPLNVNYEYRYDEVEDLFFLAPLDYKHPKKYGITKRRRTRATDGEVNFRPPYFYVKEVREENLKVIADARAIGIHNVIGVASTEDIRADYIKLTKNIDYAIKNGIIDRAYENMTEAQWQSFYRSEEERKEEILYSFAETDELEALYRSGTVKVLLSLMRKGARANEL